MSTTTATKSKVKKPAAPFSAPISEVHLVPLDLIDTTEQIRKEFDQESIANLAEDIKIRGLLQPVLLNPTGERFQLIAGERRLMAIRLNGSTGIPALIVKTSAEEAMLMQIAENIQREELTLEEECAAICKLYELLGSLAKVAEAVKKSVPWCSKRYAMTQTKLHHTACQLLANGITEDIELLKAFSALCHLIPWNNIQDWTTKISKGKAGREEVREALKAAKEAEKIKKAKEAAKAKKVSHAKPKEPPPPPPWKLDDAIDDLSQALTYTDNELSALELLNTWTEEQRMQVENRFMEAAAIGAGTEGIALITKLVLKGLYTTPYIDIDLLAMINGYSGKPFVWLEFLAQLQCPREKA